MTIVFFGSSDFSLVPLKACRESPHQLLLVITTPDQKKGRGLKESPTPVRALCQAQGITVEAPANLKDNALLEKIKKLRPELFVVASYGKIIPTSWLGVPSKLALNVHPSLLPKYRGAAPIHWALLDGEKETGVSIAELTSNLDAGDVLFQDRIPIKETHDAVSLSHDLAELSYRALKTVFQKTGDGTLKKSRQQESLSSYARKLTKEDGILDWSFPAPKIFNRIRGLLPWPVATTRYKQESLQVLKAALANKRPVAEKPGQILEIQKSGAVEVQTGEGTIMLERVRPTGKKEMTAADFARGRRIEPGAVLE